MKLKSSYLMVAMLLFCCVGMAQAAITCTAPVSTGFATAYASAGVVPNSTQASVSFTCTRGLAGDATSLLLRANNGVNTCAGSNDASFGGSCINYEAYQNSACSTVWTANNNASSIVVTLANVLTAQPISITFWGCVTVAGQAPAAGAGTYTDTVTMTVRGAGGAPTYSTGTFPASVTYPASCSMTTAPGDILFAYTAFGSTVNANTTFTMSCTSKLPYSMSLDAYTGVVGGLVYTLNINTVAPPAGAAAVTARGTGPGQIHTIYGNMVSGQPGDCVSTNASTCAATQTNVRSLTITY